MNIPHHIAEACLVLERPALTRRDIEAMSVETMTEVRLEAEGYRATLKGWLAQAKTRRAVRGVYTDPLVYRRIEQAEAAHVERIRLVHPADAFLASASSACSRSTSTFSRIDQKAKDLLR